MLKEAISQVFGSIGGSLRSCHEAAFHIPETVNRPADSDDAAAPSPVHIEKLQQEPILARKPGVLERMKRVQSKAAQRKITTIDRPPPSTNVNRLGQSTAPIRKSPSYDYGEPPDKQHLDRMSSHPIMSSRTDRKFVRPTNTLDGQTAERERSSASNHSYIVETSGRGPSKRRKLGQSHVDLSRDDLEAEAEVIAINNLPVMPGVLQRKQHQLQEPFHQPALENAELYTRRNKKARRKSKEHSRSDPKLDGSMDHSPFSSPCYSINVTDTRNAAKLSSTLKEYQRSANQVHHQPSAKIQNRLRSAAQSPRQQKAMKRASTVPKNPFLSHSRRLDQSFVRAEDKKLANYDQWPRRQAPPKLDSNISKVSPISEGFHCSSDDELLSAEDAWSFKAPLEKRRQLEGLPNGMAPTSFITRPTRERLELMQHNEDPVRVRIAECHSLAIPPETENLLLRFGGEQNKIFVERDSSRIVKDSHSPFESLLEISTLSRIIFCESHTEIAVQERHSASVGSLRYLCIKFLRIEDVECFVERVSLSNPHIQIEKKSRQLMKSFNKLRHEDIRKKRARQSLGGQPNREVPLAQQPTGDDEILYEGDSDNAEQEESENVADHVSPNSSAVPSTTSHDERPRRLLRRSGSLTMMVTAPDLPRRWTDANPRRKDNFFRSVVYPTTGPKRVSVDPQDLERLDEGEFLNDNVINFALRKIEEETAGREQIHFFNTYFFSALTTANGRRGFNYAAVKRWTKGKDIFAASYIVVPINVNIHWYLAIICNLPSLARKLCPGDDTFQASNADAVETDEVASRDRQSQCTKDTPSTTPKNGGSKTDSKSNPSLRGKEHDPVIITLDSFGNSHPGELRSLKDYVVAEAAEKRGMAVDLKQLRGFKAKNIPEQPNFCDCGLYLIGYAEQFAKDPQSFVEKILSQVDMTPEFGNFDASAKRTALRDDILRLNDEQNLDRANKRKLKPTSHKIEDDRRLAIPGDTNVREAQNEESARIMGNPGHRRQEVYDMKPADLEGTGLSIDEGLAVEAVNLRQDLLEDCDAD